MKLFKKIRKGFTLIELVVVIAVIAILSAVSVVSYVAITENAKKTADTAAVRQMNNALIANEITSPRDIFELYALLESEGMSAKNYKPLANDTFFFWDQAANRIVYAKYENGSYVGIFPEQYKGKQKGASTQWYSLSGEIKAVTPTKTGDTYSIDSAEKLYGLSKLEESDVKIQLSSNIDLMGAELSFEKISDFDGNNKTLTGLSSTKTSYHQSEQNQAARSGLFSQIGNDDSKKGATYTSDVVIKDITIKGAVVGKHGPTGVGILVGKVCAGSKVTFRNVDIIDSSVYGTQKVGTFVGNLGAGEVVIESTCSLTNVEVHSCEAELGKLVGGTSAGPATITNQIADLSTVTLHIDKGIDGRNYVDNGNKAITFGDVSSFKVTGLVQAYDYDHQVLESGYRPFFDDALVTISNSKTLTFNTIDYSGNGTPSVSINGTSYTTKGCTGVVRG